MRFLVLATLVGFLSGCGEGTEEISSEPVGTEQVSPATDKTQMGPPESWCRSYTTQKYCPSVCAWYSYPAPGYCGLPAES
jgi:hypothetical protein